MQTNEQTEKYNRIVEASLTLFSKYGYKKTAVDEIVLEANISKGLFYHYFKNKKDLYLHLYKELSISLTEKIYKISNADNKPKDLFHQIRNMIYVQITLMKESPYMYEFFYSVRNEQDKGICQSLQEIDNELKQNGYKNIMDAVDYSQFKDNVNIASAVDIIFWTVEGYSKRITNEKREINQDVFDELDTYLSLLKGQFYK